SRGSRPKPDAGVPDATSSKTLPARSLALRFARARFGAAAADVTPGQLRRAQAILNALESDVEAAATVVDMAATEGRNDRKGFPKHLGGVLDGGFVERVRANREEEARRHAVR